MAKALRLAILAPLIAGTLSPAWGDRWVLHRDTEGITARVSLYGYRLKDRTLREELGNGLGITLDLPLRFAEREGETAVTLGVGRAQEDGLVYDPVIQGYVLVELRETLYTVMLTQRYGPGVTNGRGPYLGAGAGLMVTVADVGPPGLRVSDTESNFAFQVLAGLQFTKNVFAEFRYFNGSVPENTGFAVAVGVSF